MTDLADPTLICPIMVGRDQPVQTLRRLLDLAQMGQGQVALISGEAGIGKSRLVQELQAPLPPIAPVVVQGTCFEADQTVPYAPITDLLRAYLAAAPPADGSAAIAEVAPLRQLLPELAGAFPDLPAPVADSEQAKRDLHQALAQLLGRFAVPSGLLIIIEDVHWGDDASLEFLHAFARRVKEQRILLVLTYRADEIGPGLAQFLVQLNRERLAAELHLQRLAVDSVGAMVGAIFPEAFTARQRFSELIHSLSDGNPFFVEEILKSLVVGGDLYLLDHQWRFKPLFERHLPTTIQLNLRQRLSRLTAPAREVLSLAAVAGRRFDFALLQHLASLPERDLLPIMRELRDAQLVMETSADQFTFRHALTRQAIYNDLLLRERRNLHRTIGAALEQLYEHEAPYLGDIAYHYYQAELWDKAYTYSWQAAEWAQRLYAPSAALEHYSGALAALERAGQAPTPALLRARGQMHERVGNFEAARADYMQMITVAQETHDPAAAWQGWSDLGWLWTERDFAQAGAYFAQALELARTVEARPLVAQTLNRVGNWHLHADHLDQGRAYHHQALAIAEQLHDLRGQAEALDLLGLTSYYLGEMGAGTEYYARGVRLFRQLEDPAGLSASLAVMAMRGASYNLDTFACPPVSLETCAAEGAEALAAARKIGWRAGEAAAAIYCGFGLGPRGDYEPALRLTHLGLTIAREIEHLQWAGAAQLVLGALYRDLLAWDEARTYHEAVFQLGQELHAPLLLRMVAGHLASTYVAGQEFDQAEQVLAQVLTPDLPMQSTSQRLVWCAQAELALARHQPEAALDILERLIGPPNPAGDPIPRLAHLQGDALRQMGQVAAAETTLVAAEQAAQRGGLLPRCWRILVSLGRCYQAQRHHDRAEAAFARAQEIVSGIAARLGDPQQSAAFAQRTTALIQRHYHPSPRRVAKRALAGLTAREAEIAALVAAGKSNRAIAAALTLSERTVAKHVENILAKLNFTSRAQIATWAVQRGLRAPHP